MSLLNVSSVRELFVLHMGYANGGQRDMSPQPKRWGRHHFITIPQSWWFHSNYDYPSSDANCSSQCIPVSCRPQSLCISRLRNIFGKRLCVWEVFYLLVRTREPDSVGGGSRGRLPPSLSGRLPDTIPIRDTIPCRIHDLIFPMLKSLIVSQSIKAMWIVGSGESRLLLFS